MTREPSSEPRSTGAIAEFVGVHLGYILSMYSWCGVRRRQKSENDGVGWDISVVHR
jgi:hypothetical protein